MKSFKSFISENSIHYFDIDDTLTHTSSTKIHVRDGAGKRVNSLSPSEFNNHKLSHNQSYDFSDFKSSAKFKVKPIHPMMNKMKAIHKNGGKVEMLTARSDMDDKNKFKKKWSKAGVNINKIHVRRSGNLNGTTQQNKAAVISAGIHQHGHKEVHLYDDSLPNIQSMLALKKHHPGVSFHGHHVEHNKDGTIKVTHYKA